MDLHQPAPVPMPNPLPTDPRGIPIIPRIPIIAAPHIVMNTPTDTLSTIDLFSLKLKMRTLIYDSTHLAIFIGTRK